jgi:hypothetical protein
MFRQKYYIYASNSLVRMIKSLKIFVILLFLTQLSFAQLTDDFTDGDFTGNPVWSGDDANWTIDLNQLRTNGPAVTPTTTYLSVSSSASTAAEWNFLANPKCATSGGNYMDIVLISDAAAVNGNFNGYFVRIGGTPDEVSLFRKDGAVSTKIIDGTDGIIASSSNNPARVKAVRDASNNWTLECDVTGGTNYILQGTVIDATYLTSSFFGVVVTYSASNNIKYYLDDIYAGPIIVDVTPPAISSVTVISSSQLDVYFDENVEQSTAETETNYSVNNSIGNPSSALRDGTDLKLVHLTFATSFTSGLTNTITINNTEDNSGNGCVNETANFMYLSTGTAAYRDVIINEIFADPSPQIALPTVEFIELYNRGNDNFDLTNWTFSDASSTTTLGNFILMQGEYVIICSVSDTALFSPYGNFIGVSSFPSLNNTGDDVIIKDNNGNLIDKISFTDNWYNDATKDDGGWTLELINPTLPCSGSNNWISSNDAGGGTPGEINSVYSNSPDVAVPKILSVSVSSLSQIIITFSESMDSLSLTGATYTFSNGITATTILPIGPEFNTAILDITPNLDSLTLYSLSISGATDCSGNSVSTATFYFGIGVKPLPFELVINEIFADPGGSPGLPENEFIEIRNVTSKLISLNGCIYSDPTATAVLGNEVIYPNGFLIICASADELMFDANIGRALGISPWPSLNNAGDSLVLKNASGQVIHKVNYSDNWYADDAKDDGGWTLEMIDPLNPCGEENNWRASDHPDGGTPYAVNSVNDFNPDNDAPQISNAGAADSVTVEILFNEITDSLSMMSAVYTIDNGINILSVNYITDKKVRLNLDPLTYLQYDIIYTVSVTGCEDCIGNTATTTKTIALPEQATAGDLVINEILYDPRESGADFVEVYNNSDKIISLKNWTFANFSNDTVAAHELITSDELLLFPGEYAAFTEDKNNILVEYPLGNSNRIFEISDLPSYNNGEGTVYLISNTNEMIDQFSYNDNMHFALLNSVDGISLERLDFNRPSDDVTNWHSAAESVNFASPGYQNSQYIPVENTGSVSIDPNVFSPDNDGYQDVINISYEFTEPGNVANIFIFDASGRIVRKLIQNELLGASGVISWDGINERREKAGVGAYICYFEIFNANGDVQKYKIPFVLAAKF